MEKHHATSPLSSSVLQNKFKAASGYSPSTLFFYEPTSTRHSASWVPTLLSTLYGLVVIALKSGPMPTLESTTPLLE